jgi:hypothetical protein
MDRPRDALVRDALAAGALAAALSGAPSTLHAVVTGRDPLEAARAAGAMLLPGETRALPLLVAAGPVHGAISLFWALVLARTLPRRHTALAGAAAGLATAALDLGLIGRRIAPIRRLAVAPQVADHVAFGALAGAVLARRWQGRPPAAVSRRRSRRPARRPTPIQRACDAARRRR